MDISTSEGLSAIQRSYEQEITILPDDEIVVGVTVGSVTVYEPIVLVPKYLSDSEVLSNEPIV
ncbi:hypothetical protein GOP47_0005573 [Adiantum capillus-veneris]|uniref:Uncharacterized protein n=1 Tax=Adiantum capillus-veneris TaxID=13818 RepID=A0A9D4ZLQ0_ADICA|nr:hypothetical protein GOP47_0005573 [Adiantum capillus-veneris]